MGLHKDKGLENIDYQQVNFDSWPIFFIHLEKLISIIFDTVDRLVDKIKKIKKLPNISFLD